MRQRGGPSPRLPLRLRSEAVTFSKTFFRIAQDPGFFVSWLGLRCSYERDEKRGAGGRFAVGAVGCARVGSEGQGRGSSRRRGSRGAGAIATAAAPPNGDGGAMPG